MSNRVPWLLAGLLATALVPSSPLADAQQSQQRRSPGLFSPLDLGLLEPPDREAWQKPEQVMDALYIGEGSVVADLGAGGGWFTIRLARRVGHQGKVYAEDIQRLMIEAITRRVQREGLANVEPILGNDVDPFPGLAPGTLDAVLIVDAFHEMADPVVLLRNVARALKPRGRIGIIDYREGEGGPGPDDPQSRVPPSVIVARAGEAGLAFDREETFLTYQYFLVFKK